MLNNCVYIRTLLYYLAIGKNIYNSSFKTKRKTYSFLSYPEMYQCILESMTKLLKLCYSEYILKQLVIYTITSCQHYTLFKCNCHDLNGCICLVESEQKNN